MKFAQKRSETKNASDSHAIVRFFKILNEICTYMDHTILSLELSDVYHWSCLESTFRSLPITTAPAGYQCPSCRTSLFPPLNLVSPVADVLREKLAGVNWARAGLGLPLVCIAITDVYLLFRRAVHQVAL